MKRIYLVRLALLFTLLLCACNRGNQALGMVTAYENHILSVEAHDGKRFDFQIDPAQTRILGLVGMEEDPLGDGSGRRVEVTYTKKQGSFYAETVFVNARLHRSAMTLADGTPIDIWEGKGSWDYCLKDGTVLLCEDHTQGLETNAPWTEIKFGEEISEAARKGIVDYYSQMGLHYDVPALLEDEYRLYSLSEEYLSQPVSQAISVEAWNENIISCKMLLVLPQERSNGGTDTFWEGAVFDRQTGRHIPNYDLFTISPEELETCLLDLLDPEGTLDRESMALNLQPEQLILTRNGDIAFYLVDKEENGVKSMLEMKIPEKKAREILQPWARVLEE